MPSFFISEKFFKKIKKRCLDRLIWWYIYIRGGEKSPERKEIKQ